MCPCMQDLCHLHCCLLPQLWDFMRPPSHPTPAPHLHLKSQEPAARRTLLGCQSRLSTVERMGFLMCLQTHLCGEGVAAEGQHHHPQSPPGILGSLLMLVRAPSAPGAALGHCPAVTAWAWGVHPSVLPSVSISRSSSLLFPNTTPIHPSIHPPTHPSPLFFPQDRPTWAVPEPHQSFSCSK